MYINFYCFFNKFFEVDIFISSKGINKHFLKFLSNCCITPQSSSMFLIIILIIAAVHRCSTILFCKLNCSWGRWPWSMPLIVSQTNYTHHTLISHKDCYVNNFFPNSACEALLFANNYPSFFNNKKFIPKATKINVIRRNMST